MPAIRQYEDRDKEYANERNKLIPAAESYANRTAKTNFPGGNLAARMAWYRRWNTAFHGKMGKLWAERVAQ
jgi:hypothetical protein